MTYTGSRLALLALVVALTAAVSGYFKGLRQSVGVHREVAAAVLPSAHAGGGSLPSHVPQAPTYVGMSTHEHQPNYGWHAQLQDLPPPPTSAADVRALTVDEQDALRLMRARRRAFHGAPPVVPHAIEQHHSEACLACHGKPTQVGRIVVPQISHGSYSQCLQCHAAGVGPAPDWASPPPDKITPKLDNSFAGVAAPVGASRAFPGAPAVMPHAFWMRQNCISCHGLGGSSAIKPDHAARQNCLQCHATNSSLEQRPFDFGPPAISVSPLPAAALKAGFSTKP